jgi:serine/threonine-protein kinase RsbW
VDDPAVLSALRVPARLEEVRTLAEGLRQACAAAGMGDDAAFELELAMVEAANNIVLHGYVGRDDTVIRMEVRRIPAAIEVTLTDTGAPIPASVLDLPGEVSVDSEHGRGIAIIRAFVDGMDYRSLDGVNRLLLRKALAG